MPPLLPLRGRCRIAPEGASAAVLAALLLATPAAAQAPTPLFILKNGTKTPIRCLLLEGGPVTKLVTLKPGQQRTAPMPRTRQVSLACPKVRDTVFGPLGAGRYEFRTAGRRTDLVAAAH